MAKTRSDFGWISPPLDKKGRVIARWWEGEVRRKATFDSAKEARAEMARLGSIYEDDGDGGARRGLLRGKRNATFAHVAEEWLRLWSARKQCHRNDVNNYTHRIKPFFQELPIRAVDRTKLLEFRLAVQDGTYTVRRAVGKGKDRVVRDVVKPLQLNTQRLILAEVGRILNFAAEHDYIEMSPVKKMGKGKFFIQIPRIKRKNPIESPADVWRVLQAIKDLDEERGRQLHPLYCLLVMSGLRRGEALALLWTDIDMAGGLMTVRQTYDHGTTKSKKERVVPLHPDLVPILKAHKLADPWNGPLVFPNRDGELYSEDAKIQTFLHEALRRCNLPRVKVHDLRHVFASHFVEGGGDLPVLQEILGHATPTMTQTYAHMSPTFMKGQITRVAFKPDGLSTPEVPSGQVSLFARRPHKIGKPE